MPRINISTAKAKRNKRRKAICNLPTVHDEDQAKPSPKKMKPGNANKVPVIPRATANANATHGQGTKGNRAQGIEGLPGEHPSAEEKAPSTTLPPPHRASGGHRHAYQQQASHLPVLPANSLLDLQQHLGYFFNDTKLLLQAVQSCPATNSKGHHAMTTEWRKLALLGDSMLKLAFSIHGYECQSASLGRCGFLRGRFSPIILTQCL
jgi:hypothetical protein